MNENFTDTLQRGLGGAGDRGSKGFKILKGASKRDDLTQQYFNYLQPDSTRVRKYEEFDSMDEGIIATALDLIVDDATQYDREMGATMWVNTSGDKKTSEMLNELLTEIINIDEVLADWGRQTAKYGDFFVRVYGEKGKGITRIDDSYHPSEVERIDEDGELVGFNIAGDEGKPERLEPWDFVHFKTQGSPKRKAVARLDLRAMQAGQKKKRNSTKYGMSILENAIVPNKKLNMLEDSLVLARLARSPLRRLYFINVGTANVKEAASTINFFKNIMKKKQSIGRDGNFKSENHPFTSEEDVFIPVNDSKNDVRVEEFGGEVDVRGIADIDFLKNKLFASLKVPQAFLGFEESLNGRNTLRQLDARYARTVKKVQTAILKGLVKLCQIHLAYLDINPDPKTFEIQASYVSTIEEMERQEAIATAADSLGRMVDLLGALDEGWQILDKQYLIYYILKEQFHFNDDFIKKIAPTILQKSSTPAPAPKEPEEQPSELEKVSSYTGTSVAKRLMEHNKNNTKDS